MELSLLSNFAMIASIALLGAASPGPDFVIVTKNSLSYSRRSGLFTAFGIVFGLLFHMGYCLIGLGFFIAESIVLFNCIKYSGAAYLIYIGVKSLKTRSASLPIDQESIDGKKDLSDFQSFKMGMFTNLLNPKATLFFLSLFSQVIDPETSFLVQLIYAIEILVVSAAWFGMLALLLSHPQFRSRILPKQYYFEKGMGCILLMLGFRIALI